jgi:hypothetical protein
MTTAAFANLASPAPPAGGHPLRLLNFERRWLLAIIATILPTGVGERLPWGAADAPLGSFLDDLLDSAPLKFVAGVRACVWLVVLCPPLLLGRMKTFFGLDAEDQLLVLERLKQSPIYVVREMPLMFKMIVCLGFCGLPHVQQKLGIHPTDTTPPEWARPEREGAK